jgi:hypothetical protein
MMISKPLIRCRLSKLPSSPQYHRPRLHVPPQSRRGFYAILPAPPLSKWQVIQASLQLTRPERPCQIPNQPCIASPTVPVTVLLISKYGTILRPAQGTELSRQTTYAPLRCWGSYRRSGSTLKRRCKDAGCCLRWLGRGQGGLPSWLCSCSPSAAGASPTKRHAEILQAIHKRYSLV